MLRQPIKKRRHASETLPTFCSACDHDYDHGKKRDDMNDRFGPRSIGDRSRMNRAFTTNALAAFGPFSERRAQRRCIFHLSLRMIAQGLLVAVCLISDGAFGQTTRTNPSTSGTTPTVRSSSSTSPNTPCASSNPTSPCYSAGAPRNPCYSAVAPNEPCSTRTTTAPTPELSPKPLPSATTTPRATAHALTRDQAKAQIEAKGYSNVSNLRRDGQGNWHASAEKDGLRVNVTLDRAGNVIINSSPETPRSTPSAGEGAR